MTRSSAPCPSRPGCLRRLTRWPRTSKPNWVGRGSDRRPERRFALPVRHVGHYRPQSASPRSFAGALPARRGVELLRQSGSGLREFGPCSAVRGDDGQPPGRRREARSGDFPRRSRRACTRRPRQLSLSAIPCPATARARGARAWASSGSRPRTSRSRPHARTRPGPSSPPSTRLPDLIKVLK